MSVKVVRVVEHEHPRKVLCVLLPNRAVPHHPTKRAVVADVTPVERVEVLRRALLCDIVCEPCETVIVSKIVERFTERLRKFTAHGIIIFDEALHGVHGRGDSYVAIVASVFVAKEMDTHHVKGRAEPSADWVCIVVGVNERVVVVNYSTACSCSGGVCPSVSSSLHVHTGKEFYNSVCNRVRSVERSNYTRLCKWVTLFLSKPFDDTCLTVAVGPLLNVPPVGVGGQNYIWVCEVSLHRFAAVFSVARNRGPIHQAVALIRGIVKLLNADVIGKSTCNRFVLCRRHGA